MTIQLTFALCVCVCVCVCAWVCNYLYRYMCVYVCHTHTHKCIYVYSYTLARTHRHAHTHILNGQQEMTIQLTCAKSRTATHCNTLQHTATHCNTLQHTATHCNTHTPAIGNHYNANLCEIFTAYPRLTALFEMSFPDSFSKVSAAFVYPSTFRLLLNVV